MRGGVEPHLPEPESWKMSPPSPASCGVLSLPINVEGPLKVNAIVYIGMKHEVGYGVQGVLKGWRVVVPMCIVAQRRPAARISRPVQASSHWLGPRPSCVHSVWYVSLGLTWTSRVP